MINYSADIPPASTANMGMVASTTASSSTAEFWQAWVGLKRATQPLPVPNVIISCLLPNTNIKTSKPSSLHHHRNSVHKQREAQHAVWGVTVKNLQKRNAKLYIHPPTYSRPATSNARAANLRR
ncbi:hypothetical protein E2C01_082500 [Portunus trituberculatus]|uniref:Uncharacterized protein n=1 Tax=Portunus trituberculatus TaxID=210409 RepID=A0A5B7ISI7_PORTR|nr:hypothetical protein [Portunus trituberculatus]